MYGTGSSVSGNGSKIAGIFGTKGVEAASNAPPTTYFPVMWSDKQGSLWVFGGADITGVLNTLWRYRKSTGYWTWMGGAAGDGGSAVFGASGEESASYTPPAVSGPGFAADESGYIWLFGGNGTYLQNGLWRYNISSGKWAWMSCTKEATGIIGYVAGASGEEASGNCPGVKSGSAMWYDKHGYLWVFGGTGYNTSNTQGYMNDLWRYNIATNKWAWISGSPGSITIGSTFGTQGYILKTNVGGARVNSMSWYDGTYAYLFGGYGAETSSSIGYFNTLQRTKLYTN